MWVWLITQPLYSDCKRCQGKCRKLSDFVSAQNIAKIFQIALVMCFALRIMGMVGALLTNLLPKSEAQGPLIVSVVAMPKQRLARNSIASEVRKTRINQVQAWFGVQTSS
jgi:hypothetical protein